MGNEEKILEILSEINAEIKNIGSRIDKLDGRMDGMESSMFRTNLSIENEIIPQLRLLAEGHEMIANTLAPKDRVEELEGDVKLLKLAFQTMNAEIQQLKKAQ